MGATYAEIVADAKRNQQADLLLSKDYSQQLNKTLRALINSNSSDKNLPLSAIDKITTIHQLNTSIDNQLSSGISKNFLKLKKANQEMDYQLSKGSSELNYKFLDNSIPASNHNQSVVDSLFRRAELADKELRILENTIKIINEQR